MKPARKHRAEVVSLPVPDADDEPPAPQLEIVRRRRQARECRDTVVHVPGYGFMFSCEHHGTRRVPYAALSGFMKVISLRNVLRSVEARWRE